MVKILKHLPHSKKYVARGVLVHFHGHGRIGWVGLSPGPVGAGVQPSTELEWLHLRFRGRAGPI